MHREKKGSELVKTQEELKQYSQLELCEIYDTLQSWEWDERIGAKPQGFDELPNYNYKLRHKLLKPKTKEDYINPVIAAIEKTVPRKELFRYHHLHNLKRTNEEFERWWSEERGNLLI